MYGTVPYMEYGSPSQLIIRIHTLSLPRLSPDPCSSEVQMKEKVKTEVYIIWTGKDKRIQAEREKKARQAGEAKRKFKVPFSPMSFTSHCLQL